MKIQTKKVFCSIITLSVVSGIALSCSVFDNDTKSDNSKTNKTLSEEGWKQDTTPITFDWYVDFSWFATKWGTNPVSKYVTDKTGVSLNFITPSGDETEKLNAMIDTGKLPDLITLHSSGDGFRKVLKNDLVLSLDKLADQYDAYFMKVADKQKLDWYTQPDGHVYSYPNFSNPLTDVITYKDEMPSNQVFLVRKDIYEAIGKPDMRTPEGFLSALEKAKAQFPMINGQELIPIGFHEFNDAGNLSLDWMLPNFLAIPLEVDGKLHDRFTDEEYIRWLKTFRRANEKGLLSKDIFLDRRAQIEEKTADGRYFAMLYQSSDMGIQQLKLYSEDKNKIYIPVDGPANSKLDPPRLATDSITGWTVTLISKNCKDPKRAIRFLSYLISEEGQKDIYLGVKGVTWDVIDGKEQFKPEVVQLLNSDRVAFDNKYGAANTYWMMTDSKLIQKWMPTVAEPIKMLQDWTKGKTYNYSVFENISPFGDSGAAVAFSRINNKWRSTMKNLLIAESDDEFDRILNEFITYRNQEGGDKTQKYQQQKYEENKRKLNVTK